MEPTSAPSHRGAVPWHILLLTETKEDSADVGTQQGDSYGRASLITFSALPTTAQQSPDIFVKLMLLQFSEGNDVLLLVHNLPENVTQLDWFRDKCQPDKNIGTLTLNPENISNGPANRDRETIYPNGSLLIRNLIKQDTGIYLIKVTTVSGEEKYGQRILRVYEPLPKVHITVNNSNPLEQEDSVVLTCEPKSPGTTYRWFFNTLLVQPSTSHQLSSDSRILTVLHVTRNNTGPYKCEISNQMNAHHSDPFNLTVLYGPDGPIISPSKYSYSRGENLSLSCLTASNPPAQYSWYVGKKLLVSTHNLFIPSLSLNDSGSFSCLVRNSVTQFNRTMEINITVFEPVAAPSIQASNTTVTECASPVALTCLTDDTGVSTRWYLNDKDLQSAERRMLSANNRTLILQPVLMADEGDYQCEVSNPISSKRSDDIRLQVTRKGTTGMPVGTFLNILIGVLIGVKLTVAIGCFLFLRRSKRNPGQHDPREQQFTAPPLGPDAPRSSAVQSENLESSQWSAFSEFKMSVGMELLSRPEAQITPQLSLVMLQVQE
ncbi:carcinoembryonic antigen-related cell adhesion molecule 6-like [Suncus etruscus]|uniref:carcinoembryonic antigen-related cell adhesion molecule 6-like n=1 Tax=Suncus etruscus TaxID=109475 RepID=UPI00210F4ED6|nr:carcinoembryonic antigen-related cell adhesion molecule 6-like [Suncus etruscus]